MKVEVEVEVGAAAATTFIRREHQRTLVSPEDDQESLEDPPSADGV